MQTLDHRKQIDGLRFIAVHAAQPMHRDLHPIAIL
jgi:hypothetical protein